ncbi:MAG: alpha/beta fold hydrolase, partial [Bacteroidota bacterium]
DSDLFVYSVEDKTMAQVNENQSGNSAADFNPDGTALMYVTDDGSEFSRLMKYEIGSGETEEVVDYNWDIYNFYYTRGGKYTVTLINEDARNKLMVADNESGEEVSFPEFENGSINNISFSRDESMATFYVGSSGMPTNLYVYDLASKELTQLTNTLNKQIASEDLVIAQNIRYKSFDELDIPAIYYLPHEASVDNKVPALVWVHGGPGGQSRQNFNSLVQFMVNHGYAVLAVNNRGSSGYGKTFYQMDDQNHGDKDLKDCVEGKNWLAQQPEIDPEKIGIIGGSYGGFMTMAALTATPEEFNVGVNLFGVTNWIRTLKSIPPWWESFKDALYLEMGDPYTDDSVRLYEISPLFHADKVTKPLIVLQGSQDPRVLQVESDEIVENVKANGVPVEYVLFEDEGHGFVKKENQIEAYSAILTFLDKYLKGEDPNEVSMNTN